MKITERSWRSRWRRIVVALRSSPEAVALGASIGVFIAFTPTMPFHMVLAALIATLLKANRPAAILATWVVNPFTIVPAFFFAYHLGRIVLFLPPCHKDAEKLFRLLGTLTTEQWSSFLEFFNTFFGLSLNVVLSLSVGGALVGLLCGAASYPILVSMGRRFRRHGDHRRRLRMASAQSPRTNTVVADSRQDAPPNRKDADTFAQD